MTGLLTGGLASAFPITGGLGPAQGQASPSNATAAGGLVTRGLGSTRLPTRGLGLAPSMYIPPSPTGWKSAGRRAGPDPLFATGVRLAGQG